MIVFIMVKELMCMYGKDIQSCIMN